MIENKGKRELFLNKNLTELSTKQLFYLSLLLDSQYGFWVKNKISKYFERIRDGNIKIMNQTISEVLREHGYAPNSSLAEKIQQRVLKKVGGGIGKIKERYEDACMYTDVFYNFAAKDRIQPYIIKPLAKLYFFTFGGQAFKVGSHLMQIYQDVSEKTGGKF